MLIRIIYKKNNNCSLTHDMNKQDDNKEQQQINERDLKWGGVRLMLSHNESLSHTPHHTIVTLWSRFF